MENRSRTGTARERTGRGRPRGACSPFVLAAVPALACLALSGCAQNNRAAANDPLLGNAGRQPPGSAAAMLPPPGPTASIAPPPTSPYSNAALASGPARPLDNGMRIGADPNRAPDSRSGQGAGTWGAVLPGTEPTGSLTHSAPPPPAPASSSYEQAQSILHAKGVVWQRLETWGDKGEWKFSCSIPNRQNPAISRTYEARAANALDAIHAVIEKLDKE